MYTEREPGTPQAWLPQPAPRLYGLSQESLSAEMGVEVGGKVDIGGHLPHHLLLSNLLGPWERRRVGVEGLASLQSGSKGNGWEVFWKNPPGGAAAPA